MDNLDNCKAQADSLLENLEEHCANNCGEMFDFFGEGSIYGETAEGDLIVGFGIIGSVNLLIGRDCVKCGGYSTEKFSPMLKRGMDAFRNLLDNC